MPHQHSLHNLHKAHGYGQDPRVYVPHKGQQKLKSGRQPHRPRRSFTVALP